MDRAPLLRKDPAVGELADRLASDLGTGVVAAAARHLAVMAS